MTMAQIISQPAARKQSRSIVGTIINRSLWTVLIGFFAGFGAFVLHVSEAREPTVMPKADAIIVLTGGQDRLKPAFRLLEAGAGQKLLVSGVHITTRKVDLGKVADVDQKLLACCVELDHKALDTIGNAEESARWLRENGFSSAILVTSNYHMPRAERELARFAGSAEILPYPLVASDLSSGRWLGEPDTLRVLATEYVKLCLSYGRSLLTAAPNGAALAKM
jgi:uncharacterized SAM-binding protein YcdF (DUF218 family)